MANTIYTTFKNCLLHGSVSLSTAVIYAALVSAAYVPNFATDQHMDLVTSNVVARAAVSGNAVSNGAFSVGAITFPAVSGPTVTQIIFYINSGSDSTSQLITCFNTSDGIGLPLLPNGSDINFSWSSSVFSL